MFDDRLTTYTYAVRERLLFVHESLRVYGFVNIAHIVRKFGISAPTAGNTCALYGELYPDLIAYNPSLQCYVGTKTSFTVSMDTTMRSLMMQDAGDTTPEDAPMDTPVGVAELEIAA